jgi:hypothetical protein
VYRVVSNAFSISKNTAAVVLLLKLRVSWSVSLVHCKVLLWRAWNPNWPAFSRPFSPMCLWTIYYPLTYVLVFLVVPFPLAFRPITYTSSLCPNSCYMTRPSHPPRLAHIMTHHWKKLCLFIKGGRGQQKGIQKPMCVPDYTKHEGCVDHSDH